MYLDKGNRKLIIKAHVTEIREVLFNATFTANGTGPELFPLARLAAILTLPLFTAKSI